LERLAEEQLVSLRYVVARLATLQAIVLAVFAEPHLVESLANDAILVALTGIFNLVAYRAMETFSHGRRIARCGAREKREHALPRTFVT
jgi:hypothetical protein